METLVTLYQTRGWLKQATICTPSSSSGAGVLLEEFRSNGNDTILLSFEELKQVWETLTNQLKERENGH